MSIILASASPRRKELLSMIAEQFEVITSTADETLEDGVAPADAVMELACRKAMSVAADHPDSAVIGSDTVVALEGNILGKPCDDNDACRMLKMLSGRQHEVITGVTLRSAEQTKSFSAHSKVRFRNLTDEEICYYIDTYHPMDKAGSYGIQEWIGYVGIEGIEGSFFNVMGLPIQRVWCELDKFIG